MNDNNMAFDVAPFLGKYGEVTVVDRDGETTAHFSGRVERVNETTIRVVTDDGSVRAASAYPSIPIENVRDITLRRS
jgi:hypothetical protein